MKMHKKLKNQLSVAALIVSTFTGPAFAADQLSLSSIFPAGTDLIIDGEVKDRRGISARSARIENDVYSLQFLGMELSASASGMLVSFDSLTVLPKKTGINAMMINNGKMTLLGQPQDAGICSLTKAVETFEASAIIITEAERQENSRNRAATQKSRLDITGASFQRAGKPICGLSGVFRSESLSYTSESGTNYLLTELETQAIVPFMPGEADTPNKVSVRLKSNEVQYSHEKEIPSVGGLDLVGRIDIDRVSAAGIAQVLMSYDYINDPPDSTYLLTQLYNAMTLLKGEVSLELPIMRLYAAGVVPSEAVANFSRVGLSTITGKSNAALKIDAGSVIAEGDIRMVGIADISLYMHGFMNAYRPEVFRALSSNIDLGWHLVPDIRLVDARFGVKDTGFDRAVEDLTTVPSARYAEGLLMGILNKYDGPYHFIAEIGLRGLVKFLRAIPDGKTYEVNFTPERLVPLTEMILLGIRDFQGLLTYGQFGYSSKE